MTTDHASRQPQRSPEPDRRPAAAEPANATPPAVPLAGRAGPWAGLPNHSTALTLRRAALLRLQRTHGNMIARRALGAAPVGAALQRQAPAAPPSTDAAQQAQEAEAAATLTLLRDTHAAMLRHSNRVVVNTANLFVARGTQPARLRFDAMTTRSDSAQMVRSLGQDPARSAYFFFGAHQTNSHEFRPDVGGTIEGNTILVRGRAASGAWRTQDDLMRTFVHEASHILTESYGLHPGTSDAANFDRYRDELRAYWMEQLGPFGQITEPDEKAQAIKEHLVGTSRSDQRAYAALRDRYWSDAAFRQQVDEHRRPDGFNLGNNPRLDHLVQMIRSQDPEAIKQSYRALSTGERQIVQRNPALLVIVDRSNLPERLRASVYGMLVGGSADQFDAMNEFLRACSQALGEAMDSSLTDMPDYLRDSLRPLTYDARLALYRLLEPVRQKYVDTLPQPARGRILHALLEDGEP